MKYLLFSFLFAASFISLNAQVLTLEECKSMAHDNYPVIKQYGLVEQTRDYNVSNALKGYLPQISFSAQAQYQSDATKFNGEIPGIDFKGLSRDQYNFSIDVNQTVYDGGAINSAKKIARRQGDVDYEQVRVSMYEINDRVEQIFFGILVIDEQKSQTLLLMDDLEVSYRNVYSMMMGGIANQTDVDAVKVEQVQARQTLAGIESSREAYVRMLSFLIGKELSGDQEFQRPSLESTISKENHRPELSLYNAQSLLVDERLKSLNVDLMPKVGVFLQGGYGDPGLNMFKTGFQAYYRVGATLSWNIGSLYTRSNDKHKLEVNKQTIESEREKFLLLMSVQSESESGEIEKIKKQIQLDDEIIELRENIRSKSEIKVANGTETVNEMLRDINSVSDARLQKSLHEVQLLQEIQKLKTINNN